jgi:hypothetical protein
MATTLAPAFQQRSTSAAISAGWVGRWGFCDLCAMPPVGAMVTITLRFDMRFLLWEARYYFWLPSPGQSLR